MKLSIRWKWMAAHLLVGSMMLVFMVVYLRSGLEKYFEARFDNRWKTELMLLKEYVQVQSFPTMSDADAWADVTGKIINARVTIINNHGKVLGDSEVRLSYLGEVENHSDRPEVIQALKKGFGESRRFSSTIDMDLVYFAAPFRSRENSQGIIRIAVPVSEIEDSLSQIHRLIWLAVGLGFVLVLLSGFFISNSMTRHMKSMAIAANKIAKGDFSTKVTLKTNDELAELGLAFNRMSKELQKYVTQITYERDQLRAIVHSMVEGVMVMDLSGKIILTNRSFMRMFSLTEPVIGKLQDEIFRDVELLEALERATQTKKDGIVVIEVSSPFRRSLEAHITILGLREKPSGTVVVFHDITQLQHLEQVRRDFVANVSHELRTPLTAIKGYAETLLENGAMKKTKAMDFLQTIVRHSDRMSKLVDDLLSLSKLESVDAEIEFRRLNLGEVISKVIESFKKINEKAELEFVVDVPKSLPAVKGIESEIENVLENLIDNAIKYGGSGKEITITARDVGMEVQVDVSDKGIGIPIDDQPRIFERFYRVDKGRSRALGGTGLGLSIVKHILHRHGGKVWVESKVGEGSIFRFTLQKGASGKAGVH